ncbi:MAG: uroporphyrinogen decarboxylase family protein [Candidatus Latescibacterota bacterium]
MIAQEQAGSPGMTPRQRVVSAISHRQPDRVPFSWGNGFTAEMSARMEDYLRARGLDWARLRQVTEDVMLVGPAYIGPLPPERTDVWGIRTKSVGYGGGHYAEFEFHPLAGASTPAEVDAYCWPDPDHHEYETLRERVLAAGAGSRQAIKTFASNPFEIYSWMTGLEESLVNLLVNPEVVGCALGHITDYFAAKLSRTLDLSGDLIDIVLLADDLGSQRGLLMSRETYRSILQPFHRRLAGIAHGMAPHVKVMFHSDGAVFDILPDLIDARIDILEAVQTDALGMEPAALKRAYGSRMSFHGGISVQSLLCHRDALTVSGECRQLVKVFGEGGGYIAAPSHAVQVGTPPENVLSMLEAVIGKEDYEAALCAARIEDTDRITRE